ncbi:hypothetical protein P7C71_g2944, partial [Lecanoromycetidae sp. Uapishka_2]
MTETQSLAIRTAFTVGIAASAIQAGITIATSSLFIPAILQCPNKTLMVSQWRSIFNKGIIYGPPLGIIACANLLYVAYSAHAIGARERSIGFAIAAASQFAIIPFTLATLMGTNSQLLKESERRGKEEGGLREGQVRNLMTKWGRLNGVRSLGPLGATLIALWTASR